MMLLYCRESFRKTPFPLLSLYPRSVALILLVGVWSCGESTAPIDPSPDLQLQVTFTERWDVSDVSVGLEFFSDNSARRLSGDEERFIILTPGELETIGGLLERYGEYATQYDQAPGSRWPFVFALLTRYEKSGVETILIGDLSGETIPPVPESLKQAVLSIKQMISRAREEAA